jgi:hypothetical protein
MKGNSINLSSALLLSSSVLPLPSVCSGLVNPDFFLSSIYLYTYTMVKPSATPKVGSRTDPEAIERRRMQNRLAQRKRRKSSFKLSGTKTMY